MDFEEITEDMCQELSEYMHPIWHGVFDSLLPGGCGEAEYIFRKWNGSDAIRDSMKEGYVYGYVSDNGQRLGMYSYRILGDGRMYVNKIYLESVHRGKGYGKRALEKMFSIAGENGCSEVFLNVLHNNERAIQTYLKCGFVFWYRCLQRLGNGYTRNDWVMRKTLRFPRTQTV